MKTSAEILINTREDTIGVLCANADCPNGRPEIAVPASWFDGDAVAEGNRKRFLDDGSYIALWSGVYCCWSCYVNDMRI